MASKLVYLLTCYRGIRDVATGLFSYMDIIDTVFIPKDNDFIWISICVGGRFYSDVPGNLKVEVNFKYPISGIFSPPIFITGIINKGDVHFAASFPITKFTEIGKYKLRIVVDGVELEGANEYYFNVTKQV